MSEIIIRSDVPIPEKRARGARAKKYPFAVMEVGQSFHIAPVDGDIKKALRRASGVSYNANKAFVDRKFEVRTVDENDPDGVGARVYRVA